MFGRTISPMLAYASDPFDSPEHIFEIKWDGTRCIIFIDARGVLLQNRRLADITARYPELSGLNRRIRDHNLILDGELVVLEEGISNFGKLQQREHIADPLKIQLLSKRMPATYMVFDLLFRNGVDCTREPLHRRRELLARVLDGGLPGVLESQFTRGDGIRFFREAVAMGLEGVMAKSLASPYVIGRRSRHWLKIKPRHSALCLIVGYTPGKGGRERFFGALALAERVEETWLYRGKVGSGLRDEEIRRLHPALERLKTERPPVPGLPRLRGVQWIRPGLMCRVIFQEIGSKGRYRAPVFAGIERMNDE